MTAMASATGSASRFGARRIFACSPARLLKRRCQSARQAHAVIVRSPHAHARIVAVDTAAALAAPGVLAVLTGADYRRRARAVRTIQGLSAPPDVQVERDGFEPIATAHFRCRTTRPLCRRAGRDRGRRDHRPGEGRRRAGRHYLRAAAGGRRAADAVEPARRCCGTTAPGNLCIDAEVGDKARPTRPSPGPRMSRGFETWCSASPACRWSRARRSANTTPQRSLHALCRQPARRRAKRG